MWSTIVRPDFLPLGQGGKQGSRDCTKLQCRILASDDDLGSGY